MATELDIRAKVDEANAAMFNGLRDFVIANDGKAPNLTEAKGLVEAGVKILLDAVTGAPAEVSDHVNVILEDHSEKKDLTKVAIHMESRTPHGATVVMLFGYEEESGDFKS